MWPRNQDIAVFSAAEFRDYAQECMEWARAAHTDAARKNFLDMAKMWTLAATQIDDCLMAMPGRPRSASGEIELTR